MYSMLTEMVESIRKNKDRFDSVILITKIKGNIQLISVGKPPSVYTMLDQALKETFRALGVEIMESNIPEDEKEALIERIMSSLF